MFRLPFEVPFEVFYGVADGDTIEPKSNYDGLKDPRIRWAARSLARTSGFNKGALKVLEKIAKRSYT